MRRVVGLGSSALRRRKSPRDRSSWTVVMWYRLRTIYFLASLSHDLNLESQLGSRSPTFAR